MNFDKTKHFSLLLTLVIVLSFTGAAFSIMTFNNDVDVTGVFQKFYQNKKLLKELLNILIKVRKC